MKNQSSTPDPGGQPPAVERNTFRMKWLLPRGQRRIEGLLPHDRARVVQSLTEAIDSSECEPIASAPYPDVFHYKVGRNIRVCFLMQRGFGVVVFVGDHAECHRAVYHKKWRLRGRFIPIEGSTIMRDEKRDSVNNNGHASGESPAAPTKPSATDFDAWIQMLPAVVDATFAAPLRHVDDARRSAIEDVRTKGNRNSMELTALTTRVDVLSQRFESHSDETNSNFATRDKAVSEADRRAHSFRHEFSTSVGGLKGDLKAFKGDVSDRFRDVSNKFESVYADLGRWSEKHEALERSVLPELATFRDFEATTKKCIAEAKTKLAVLEARDPVGPLFVRLEQHEARLKGQDETASSTRADVARSFERITSLSAEAGQFREIVDALRQDVDHLRSTVNMLSNRVESEARERIDRQNRTLAGRLSRWIERIRTGTRAGWILIRSVGRS